MATVIDSSYALACLLPDERRPPTSDAVLSGVLLAPFIWPVELANALRNGVRRNRLGVAQARGLAASLAGLETRVVAPWNDEPARLLELALTHDLTAYDALYIDLCLAERSDLATRDDGLAKAAARVGIRIHS